MCLAMKTRPTLEAYLQEILGVAPTLRGLSASETKRAPLFLRSAYNFAEVTLFGQRVILGVRRDDGGETTPGEYAKHISLIRTAMGTPVALVLPRIAPYFRNRLVRQGVPFVVPGRQMFLPFLAVDLREREPRLPKERGSSLSAAAQALLLRHLLGYAVAARPLKDVASDLGYSNMTLTNVANELDGLHLCEVVRDGRTRQLAFALRGVDLWKRALDHLISPVRARRWSRRAKTKHPKMLAAGLTVFERYTDIADDRLPTFAIWQHEYRRRVERGDLAECESSDDADAAVEVWAYDPARLVDGDCVDRLSLYLALRDTTDERVQKELKRLLGDTKW